jgi:hypothetical protein
MSHLLSGFPNYYTHLFFRRNRPSNDQAHSLINGYVRLVEGAIRFYEVGRNHIEHGWSTHETPGLADFNYASSAFEASITNMYRASTFMERIRASRDVDDRFKNALGPKPHFVKNIGKIRKLRRAIHHLDSDILQGIPRGTPIYLMATGDVVPGDGDEIKIVDRLRIGEQQVEFSLIESWLSEMAQCAQFIETYDWLEKGKSS